VSVQAINPATGAVLETFEETASEALAGILERADAASRDWRHRPVAERATGCEPRRAFCASERRVRPYDGARDGQAAGARRGRGREVRLGVRLLRAVWEAFLADEPHPTEASRSYVRFEALGPVFAIMPWNFPFWQVFRFAAPALVAGNAGILKHAPNVPRCALEIESVFRDAGFPDGLFRAVFLSNAAAGDVIADARVRAVTLTGSDRAGSQVAEQAGGT